MTWALLLVVLLGGKNQLASPEYPQRPFEVARVCGKLVHVEHVRVKNASNTFVDNRRAIPRTTLRVYLAKQGEECCLQSPIAELRTGRWGRFEFRNLEPGLVWLVAHVGERDYKMLIRIDPKKNSGDECMDFDYDIEDSGAFSVSRTITVD
jgi:hypothetical protein